MSAAADPADDLDTAAATVKAGAKPGTTSGAKAAKAGAKPVTAPKAGPTPSTPAKARAKPATPAKAAAKSAAPGAKAVKPAARSAAKPAARPAKPEAKPGKSSRPRATPKARAAVAPGAKVEAKALVETAVVIETRAMSAVGARAAADTWDAAARDALRWTSTVMVIVPAFLLLFNAASLKNWADQLSPSPTTVVIKNAADTWEATTRTLGLSAPRDALHNAWNKAVALKWDGTSGDGTDPK